jgi:hypothetical protein
MGTVSDITLSRFYLAFLERFGWYGFVDEVAAGLRMRSTFQVRITWGCRGLSIYRF